MFPILKQSTSPVMTRSNNTEDSYSPPRIPILTMPVWWVVQDTNYGSLFQAYALQRVLKQLGYAPEWIQFSFSQESWRAKASHLFKSVCRTLRWPTRLIGRKKRQSFSLQFRESYPRYFQNFLNKHLCVAQTVCHSLDELRAEYGTSASCIIGSDQMWLHSDKQYFLSFMPSGKKIAYAVSAPWSGLGSAWKRIARKELPHFTGVSVREQQGVELLKRLGIEKTEQCLDPVFLLSQPEWDEMVSTRREDDSYCLGYFLNGYKEKDIYLRNIEEYCQRQNLTLRIIPNQGAEYYIHQKYLLTPSPEQFLALFRDASCVITNSFHAVVFSMIFKKQFVIIPQKRERIHQNDRFLSLLHTFNLKDRIAHTPSEIEKIIDREIDFSDLEKIIFSQKKTSMAFLKAALNKSSNI